MAYSSQAEDIANVIQMLRAQAESNGNLKSTSEQIVTTRDEGGSRVIYIAPANPERIYVPVYDSSVVFSSALAGALIFGTGVLVGSTWNDRWGWNNRRWNQVWVRPPAWHPPPPNWRPPQRPGARPPGVWRPDGLAPEGLTGPAPVDLTGRAPAVPSVPALAGLNVRAPAGPIAPATPVPNVPRRDRTGLAAPDRNVRLRGPSVQTRTALPTIEGLKPRNAGDRLTHNSARVSIKPKDRRKETDSKVARGRNIARDRNNITRLVRGVVGARSIARGRQEHRPLPHRNRPPGGEKRATKRARI